MGFSVQFNVIAEPFSAISSFSVSVILAHQDGATMVGGEAVHGEDLENYLRTKVFAELKV